MDHKNFDFIQIPDITNDMLQKPCFWAIFDHFRLMGILPKISSSVTHTYIWPLTLSKVPEKTSEPTPRILTGRRKEGQTDPILQDSSSQGQGSTNLSSASDWWEYTKSFFKENAKIYSKNFTTQENITILRLKKTKKKTYTKEKTSNQKLNQ